MVSAFEQEKKMKRQKKKSRKNQAGFTLLEILVTLTIMGFLIAVIAPRLAGITGDGLETVTRTNMASLVNYITADRQKNGDYPRGMINIVSVDRVSGDYFKPMVSDQIPENEPEVLGFEMDRRHRFFIHYLSPAEAAELRKMGIVHVYNLNSPHDRNVVTASPQMEPVAAGVAVLMTGGGDADNDGVIGPAEVSGVEISRGHPDSVFRLVFGLGPETSLIKDGLIHNASTCPESGLQPINYVWQWYGLTLPRLAATAARLQNDDPLGNSGLVTAYHVSGSRTAAGLATTKQRQFSLYEEQDSAFFSVMDAEGVIHPDDEPGLWGMDFNNNGDIG